MYTPQQSDIISQTITRLQTEMESLVPFMAGRVLPWAQSLAGTAKPEDYFRHPLAFPSLLLPWWVENTLVDTPDVAFQAELAWSTINGYYHIRLIDNVMDDHATLETELLPAINFFHMHFQGTYQQYFEYGHPFWSYFTATWLHSGQAAMQDAALFEIDEARFKQISAQKVCAAKIPVAAVCYRYNCPTAIKPWAEFIDLFGCWHQMFNDLFDWHKDSSNQTVTWFLSEAERHRAPDEPLVAWVTREGFAWGIETLQGWMSELEVLADGLQSKELVAYLKTRDAMLLEQQAKVKKGLDNLMSLVSLGS